MASDGAMAQRSQVVILPGALAHVVQKQGNAPAIPPSIRGHADVPGGVENDDVALLPLVSCRSVVGQTLGMPGQEYAEDLGAPEVDVRIRSMRTPT